MDPVVPVTLFNANTMPVMAGINSPVADVWLGPTNAGLDWQPYPLHAAVTMTMTEGPRPNRLAIGPNWLAISPQGVEAPPPFTMRIDLPDRLWSAAQLYFFFDTGRSVSWMILDEGRYVTGSVPA